MRSLPRLLRAAAPVVLVAAAGCAAGSLALGSAPNAVPLGLDPVIPTPIENPPNPVKLALGARLFFDPLLSLDGTRSCASCHRPELAFSDTSATSRGIGDHPTRRNAPPLINRAWGKSLFRDGRALTLEAAVLQPVFNPTELGLTAELLETRLNGSAEYRSLFRQAFDAPAQAPSSENAAAALATFIRSLQSADSRADRYVAGDTTALSAIEKEGRALFFGKARCSSCHIGPNFTDEGFHNTGVTTRSGDQGRFEVTGQPEHQGAFRTPTLRDLTLTEPYMHDGNLVTLDEVIDFYDGGGIANPNLDIQIRPIGLTGPEKEALLAFLQALTGARARP